MPKEKHVKYEMLVRNLPDAFAYHKIVKTGTGKAADYIFLDVNAAFEEMTGLSKDAVIGKRVTAVHPGIEKSSFDWIGTYAKVADTGESIRFQQYFESAGKWYDIAAFSDTPGYFAVIFRNITTFRQTEIFLKLTGKVLSILNRPLDFKESIHLILCAIKHETRCDAVGIRLKEGEDFPYFLQTGFAKNFLLAENSLLERDGDGNICRNPDGTVNLECTCGLVISGATDPANPLFTEGGSCWTNNSFPLLDMPGKDDPRHNPRNRCIHDGYASVAIIPLRTGKGIIGLLQLNGKARGMFSLSAIKFLEDIATHVGEALMRKQAEDKIHYMSFHDSLTGLYNRFYMEEEMKRLDTARQMPISVIMADVNGLKLTNDTCGHGCGDELLKKTADILKGACRKEDIIARWGGDEFIVLLPQTGKKTADFICKRIRSACRKNSIRGTAVSVALGAAEKKNSWHKIPAVLIEAEKNMYEDKQKHKR